MRTLLPDPPPAPFDALLEQRRRTGVDRFDEVWEGVLHMVPAPTFSHGALLQQLAVMLDGPARAAGLRANMGGFNIGEKDDHRIPDGGLVRDRNAGVWLETAALAIEILSPGDETWAKLPFYARHRVDEVLIIDPQERRVDWLGLDTGAGEYRPLTGRSRLIELGPDELATKLDWPPAQSD